MSASRIAELIYSQGLAAGFADAILYVIIYLPTKFIPNPLPLLAVFGMQMFLAVIWSMLAHHVYFAIFPPLRSAAIHDQKSEKDGSHDRVIGQFVRAIIFKIGDDDLINCLHEIVGIGMNPKRCGVVRVE